MSGNAHAWKEGDRARYRVGRGWGEARIASVSGGIARLMTDGQKILNRKLAMLEPPTPAPAAPAGPTEPLEGGL